MSDGGEIKKRKKKDRLEEPKEEIQIKIEEQEKKHKTKNKGVDGDDNDDDEEETSSNPLEQIDISTVVKEVAKELKRPHSDADTVIQLLERSWISNLAQVFIPLFVFVFVCLFLLNQSKQYAECVEEKIEIPGLPALFRLRLTEHIKKYKRGDNSDDIGPTWKELNSPEWEKDDEDREQNRVIVELAKAFEAGEKHKVLCKVFVNNLENLSTQDSTVSFDIGIQCWFLDESHIGAEEGEPNMAEVLYFIYQR